MFKLRQLLALSCLFTLGNANLGPCKVKLGTQVATSNTLRKELSNPKIANIVIDQAPEIVKNLISDLKNNKLIASPKLLLYGETGVGKTELAKSIAVVTNRECTIIHGSSVGNEYQNSGAQNIRKAFEKAVEKNTPQVIIIEEIDTLVNGYNTDRQADKNTAAEFWLMLDETEDNPNILVIGTTNDVEKIPQQVKSRFDERTVQVFKPDTNEKRSVILRCYLDMHKHSCNDQSIEKLAKMLDSFAPRQIKQVVSIADSSARNRNTDLIITPTDLEKAIKQIMSNYVQKNPVTTILEKIENGANRAAGPVSVAVGTASLVKMGITAFNKLNSNLEPVLQNSVFAANKPILVARITSSPIFQKVTKDVGDTVIGFIRTCL